MWLWIQKKTHRHVELVQASGPKTHYYITDLVYWQKQSKPQIRDENDESSFFSHLKVQVSCQTLATSWRTMADLHSNLLFTIQRVQKAVIIHAKQSTVHVSRSKIIYPAFLMWCKITHWALTLKLTYWCAITFTCLICILPPWIIIVFWKLLLNYKL